MARDSGRAGGKLQGVQAGHGLIAVGAAHFVGRTQVQADGGALGQAEERAAVVVEQVDAGDSGGLEAAPQARMGPEMEGAMQQAPQPVRQSMLARCMGRGAFLRLSAGFPTGPSRGPLRVAAPGREKGCSETGLSIWVSQWATSKSAS
jgi:hypothetical protein